MKLLYITQKRLVNIFFYFMVYFFLISSRPAFFPLFMKRSSAHIHMLRFFSAVFLKFRCSWCEIITKVANQSLFLSIAEANGFFKKSFMLLTTSLKSTLLKLIFFAKACHFFCISGSVPNCIACSNCLFVNL